jgi:hypothetical protein
MQGPDSISIEKELNDIISKKSLLDYPGFHEFMKTVQTFYDYKASQILELTRHPVTPENIQILNLVIAERNALESLLLIHEEFKDSVNPSEETLNTYEEK